MIGLTQHPDRLEITWEGRPLCTYVIASDDPPYHMRRPYMHPVYSLADDLVTACRPADHPWHKGISMTMSVVNDQNFWGGPTYRDGRYQPLENVGETRHDGWGEFRQFDDTVYFDQKLSWITACGETWLKEQRCIRLSIAGDFWRMNWVLRFENVSGRALCLGSPATQGRPDAGYTGLFWRGTSNFQTALAGDSSDDGIDFPPANYNGTSAPLLALSTLRADGSRGTGVMFEKSPACDTFPVKWFVRADEYAGVAFSFAYDQAVTVEPGARFELDHTIYISGR